ncbi:MAG TPA: phosphotransferase [Gaiellaceae bacterium]
MRRGRGRCRAGRGRRLEAPRERTVRARAGLGRRGHRRRGPRVAARAGAVRAAPRTLARAPQPGLGLLGAARRRRLDVPFPPPDRGRARHRAGDRRARSARAAASRRPPRSDACGAPSEGFPWPFYGAPYLQGSEVAEAGLDDERRAALARPLARALRALHGPAALAAVGALLPVDPIGRADMSTRVPRTRTALAEVEALGLWRPTPAVEESLEAALALPPAEPAAVCHGDLHFRQLLVADGGLTAILDWVDVCRADPGIDLQLYWSFVPADLRDAFLHEYGPVTEASLLRARVLALFLNATLARYGHAEGLAAVEAEAVAALVRTMAYG